jgi:hypothetical protein
MSSGMNEKSFVLTGDRTQSGPMSRLTIEAIVAVVDDRMIHSGFALLHTVDEVG